MMTDTKPILVLGGTGKTGRRVAAQLRQRGVPVRAASRSGGHRFDWHDENTWEAALKGASGVYLVDLVDEAVEWDPAVSVRAFAKMAVAAGIERMVLLQARTTKEAGGKSLTGSEQEIQESGADWTILRPTWFMQNFDEGILLDAVRIGELRLPAGDGLEPFIDCGDVAAVAVAALTENGHAGRTYEMTGPRALGFDEVAEELSRATGREIRYVAVSHEDYVAELVELETPVDYAEMVADLIGQIRDGRNEHLSDGVRTALGREPMDFAQYARTAAATGVWVV